MNVKRLLRFYFSADKLNGAFDNLIMRYACGSGKNEGDGVECAERIISLICAKQSLSLLWGYLNGVMQAFCDKDCELLLLYAYMRGGLSKFDKEQRNNFRRVTVRFARKVKNLERFADGIKLVNSYYALMNNI
ncbi:MAG: hypothetical protein ACI4MH_07650 [Candidatus Coproplasma sp.]